MAFIFFYFVRTKQNLWSNVLIYSVEWSCAQQRTYITKSKKKQLPRIFTMDQLTYFCNCTQQTDILCMRIDNKQIILVVILLYITSNIFFYEHGYFYRKNLKKLPFSSLNLQIYVYSQENNVSKISWDKNLGSMYGMLEISYMHVR